MDSVHGLEENAIKHKMRRKDIAQVGASRRCKAVRTMGSIGDDPLFSPRPGGLGGGHSGRWFTRGKPGPKLPTNLAALPKFKFGSLGAQSCGISKLEMFSEKKEQAKEVITPLIGKRPGRTFSRGHWAQLSPAAMLC